MFDTLFLDARIIDGGGGPWYRGDVGVKNGKIAEIGRLAKRGAARTINADGRILSPGFIDAHTHSDFVIFRDPVMLSKLRQGVTTQVAGQCGQSAAPVKDEYAGLLKSYLGFIMAGTEVPWNWKTFDEWLVEVEKLPLAVNFASCAGHGTIRAAVMGFEDRAATPAELELMKAHLREAMEAGRMRILRSVFWRSLARVSRVMGLSAGSKSMLWNIWLRSRHRMQSSLPSITSRIFPASAAIRFVIRGKAIFSRFVSRAEIIS